MSSQRPRDVQLLGWSECFRDCWRTRAHVHPDVTDEEIFNYVDIPRGGGVSGNSQCFALRWAQWWRQRWWWWLCFSFPPSCHSSHSVEMCVRKWKPFETYLRTYVHIDSHPIRQSDGCWGSATNHMFNPTTAWSGSKRTSGNLIAEHTGKLIRELVNGGKTLHLHSAVNWNNKTVRDKGPGNKMKMERRRTK